MEKRGNSKHTLVFASFAAVLVAILLIAVGCSSSTNPGGGVLPAASGARTPLPVMITDAPGDQVAAATLTLNSIVLTNLSGQTISLLTSPLSFEATHLDAVQEPLMIPAVPADTYASVTLTYSNAEVAYIDPTSKTLVVAATTLANTSQTITFPTPVTVNNTLTSLLVDYLVDKSVVLSGASATVTPMFHVAPAPIPPQPTNGTNGLLQGIHGKVTALGANSLTITDGKGISLTASVNSSTQYQNLNGFSDLAVGMLVELDIVIQSDGTLTAARVDQEAGPKAAGRLLVGRVVSVTGSPVTQFTELVHQDVGVSATAATIAKDTITVTSSTIFELPGRFGKLSGGAAPFASEFSAATLFAGQSVSVATTGVSANQATAVKVRLNPQTVRGTIASVSGSGPIMSYKLTLAADGWLATVTGQSTVTVYTNGNEKAINPTPLTAGSQARFNGFLFNVGGSLVLLADEQGPGPGTPITPQN